MKFRVIILALITLLLAACAGTQTKSEEQVVRERAQERWDHVLAGELLEAYSYTSPGYRSAVSAEDYIVEMSLRKVKWTSSEFKEIRCKEASCEIDWSIGYEVVRPVPGLDKWAHKSTHTDHWIKMDGEWWYVPKSR